MNEFYRQALIGLVVLLGVSALAGHISLQGSYLQLPLLGAKGLRVEPGSDAGQGGKSTVRVLESQPRLRFDFNIEKAVDHPFASAALVFTDRHGKDALVDLSRYSSISFTARCSPANTLTLGVANFEASVSRPGNLLSYRSPSAVFPCDTGGGPVVLDLTRLETPPWWFDMFQFDIARRAYKLDNVARIFFITTSQSPMHVQSTVELGDISLNGRDYRYLYGLGVGLLIAWSAYGIWFFRQHTRALIADVQDKLQRDLPLLAYQHLSIEPHKDKEKSAVLRFIAAGYADAELDVDSVVTQTGVNRAKINEILRAELGYTFSGYLNKLRLTEAARLLAEKNSASVAEIAYSVGYANVSYFNKLFKEEYNCTPKAFRTACHER
jgi:AraC-like DNA-binding protein